MVSYSPCKEEDRKHQPKSLFDLRYQVSKCQNSIKWLIQQQERTMNLLQDMYAYLKESEKNVEMRPNDSSVIRESKNDNAICFTIFCTCTQKGCSCEGDTDDEKIIFNMRSTSRDIPILGASTDEESHSESYTHEESSNSEDEVIHMINTIKISSDEEGETSLAIEKVPKNHHKDHTPREVNQVQVLRTFIVPQKKKNLEVK
jgi:hypothetical protein